jgi:hypothetical protein
MRRNQSGGAPNIIHVFIFQRTLLASTQEVLSLNKLANLLVGSTSCLDLLSPGVVLILSPLYLSVTDEKKQRQMVVVLVVLTGFLPLFDFVPFFRWYHSGIIREELISATKAATRQTAKVPTTLVPSKTRKREETLSSPGSVRSAFDSVAVRSGSFISRFWFCSLDGHEGRNFGIVTQTTREYCNILGFTISILQYLDLFVLCLRANAIIKVPLKT